MLARKASVIARREQLASWLYGVARHTALDARARALRQQSKEKRLGSMSPAEEPDQADTSELRAILDEELARLPERYRTAIVLCELEGLSRREAAGRLGVSEGTLSSRLARAKEQLRGRLTRRGLALSTAGLASALSHEAHAVIVAPALVDSTIRVAILVAAGSSLAGVVSTSVATLTEGALKAMLFAKLKLIVLGVVSVALVTTGVGVVAQSPGPVPHADQDRLKAVEQKLDKLLEVLTRQFNPVPPTATLGVLLPATSTSITTASSPDVLPPPPMAVATPTPFATHGGAVGERVDQTNFAHGPGQSGATSTSATTSVTSSQSLDGRVASLEQRLGDLERRFNDLEKRFLDRDSRSIRPAAPAGAASAPRRRSAGPFELDPEPANTSDRDPFQEATTAGNRKGVDVRSRALPRGGRTPNLRSSGNSSADTRPRDVEPAEPAAADDPQRDDVAPPSADAAPEPQSSPSLAPGA